MNIAIDMCMDLTNQVWWLLPVPAYACWWGWRHLPHNNSWLWQLYWTLHYAFLVNSWSHFLACLELVFCSVQIDCLYEIFHLFHISRVMDWWWPSMNMLTVSVLVLSTLEQVPSSRTSRVVQIFFTKALLFIKQCLICIDLQCSAQQLSMQCTAVEIWGVLKLKRHSLGSISGEIQFLAKIHAIVHAIIRVYQTCSVSVLSWLVAILSNVDVIFKCFR